MAKSALPGPDGSSDPKLTLPHSSEISPAKDEEQLQEKQVKKAVQDRDQDQGQDLVPVEQGTPTETASAVMEKWNEPSVNRNRYFATIVSLTVMGMNDACIGALVPYVRITTRPAYHK